MNAYSSTAVGGKNAAHGIRTLVALVVVMCIAGFGQYHAVGAASLAANADDTSVTSGEEVLRGSGYVVVEDSDSESVAGAGDAVIVAMTADEVLRGSGYVVVEDSDSESVAEAGDTVIVAMSADEVLRGSGYVVVEDSDSESVAEAGDAVIVAMTADEVLRGSGYVVAELQTGQVLHRQRAY